MYLCGKDWNDPEARVQSENCKVYPRLFGRKEKKYNVGEKVLVQMKRPNEWDGTATVWCEGIVTKVNSGDDGLYCIKTKAGMVNQTGSYYVFVGPNKLHPLLCLEKEKKKQKTDATTTTTNVAVRRSGRKRKAKKIFDL